MIAPFAEALGFDGVVATVYEVTDGRYTGRLDGGFVWGLGKLQAVKRWADAEGVDLAECHACSDSFFDLPLLSSVGSPHAVNPDPRLDVVASAPALADRVLGPPGRRPLGGRARALPPAAPIRATRDVPLRPLRRRRASSRIPRRGPVLLASNHRSYFDVVALAIVAAKIGRPVRFLAKRELFDAPVIGWVARSIGGIPVDRGSGSDQPLREAEAALRAGEVVIVLPEGTIPRGEAFFDPVLHGKTGTARLAASTGAPVLPIGLWGTERVWPRSVRVPDVTGVRHPPAVRVRVGDPVPLDLDDARADTATLMAAISALLPPEARRPHHPEPRRAGSDLSPREGPLGRPVGDVAPLGPVTTTGVGARLGRGPGWPSG